MSPVIMISILFSAVCIFFAVFLSRKPKVLPKEKIIQYIKIAINYKVSLMAKADGCDYAVINVSITNNYNTVLEGIQFKSSPVLPVTTRITIKDPAENNDGHGRRYESLTTMPLSIPAGTTISGYLIYSATEDICPIDQLTVSANGQQDVVPVYKQRIQAETVLNRQF